MKRFLKICPQKMALILGLGACLGMASPSYAAGSPSGFDTSSNQPTMPFSVQGVLVMTLTGTGLTMSQGNLDIQNGNMALDTGSVTLANGNLLVSGTPSQSTGRIGVGTLAPVSALDVSEGYIHIGQTASQGANCGSIQGLLATDATGHMLSCISGIWTAVNKPTLTQTDEITCVIGTNPGRGPCNSGGGSPGNISYTTPIPHDLCVLSQVAGWSGGFWGQCMLDGTPGARWNIRASNYSPNQTTCRMTCYDFQ